MTSDTLSHGCWTPAGAEEIARITAALEEVLSSAPFRASHRYPAMLRYIVEKTLSQQSDSLKERTIGVEVFHRAPGYDTNADPVVRFSAGEIRRRLALFYQESGASSPIVLELPSGTYVPRFHRRAELSAESAETKRQSEAPHEAQLIPIKPSAPAPEPAAKHRRPWVLYAVVIVLACALAGTFIHARMARNTPVTRAWTPMLNNQSPVLICAGSPVQNTGTPAVVPNTSIGNHILQPDLRVSMATLNAIADVAGYLKSEHKLFRIQDASADTLSDLYERPVVLVAGNDNKWTVLLLKPLRFHFVQVGQFSYIEDAKNPGFRGWNVDFSKPFQTQTADYAIVGRFHSSVTGGPVMVAAGISSAGTVAAGEFLVSSKDMATLEKSNPAPRRDQNFEAILRVDVVGGNSGAATVVATQFW